MKTKIIAIILAIIAVAGAATGAVFALNTPKKAAISAVSQVFEDFFERDDVSSLKSVFEQGSLNLSAKNIKNSSKEVLFDGEIKGKLYFSKNAFMLDSLEIPINNKPLSFSLRVSEDGISISESNAIKDALGITKGNAAQSFKDSIFAIGSGSDYELNTALTQQITNALSAYDAQNAELLKKDTEKLIKEYVKQLYKLICDNAVFESENTETTLDGEASKVRVITVSLDADGAVAVTEGFYEFIREDEQLKKLLSNHEDYFLNLAKLDDTYTEGMTLDEFTDKALSDLQEDVKRSCDEIKEELKDKSFTVELITPRLSSKLLKLSVKHSDDTKFFIELGKEGIKNTDKVTLYANEVTTVYKKLADDKGQTVFSVTQNDNEVFTLSLDKENKSFRLDLNGNILQGELDSSSNSSTFAVSSILIDGVYYTSDITLTVKKKDTMPSAFEYKQIGELSQTEFEAYKDNLIKYFSEETPPPEYDAPTDDENWSLDY